MWVLARGTVRVNSPVEVGGGRSRFPHFFSGSLDGFWFVRVWFRRLNRVSVGFLSACGVIWARIAKLGSMIGSDFRGPRTEERGCLGFRNESRLQFWFLIKCNYVMLLSRLYSHELLFYSRERMLAMFMLFGLEY